jgi:DNA-binding HxlR family transcriptional regulator
MGTDLLSGIRREIDARLEELRPALAEYEQLLQAAGALGLDGDVPAARSPRRQGARARISPAQRRASRAAASTPRAVPAERKPRAVRNAAREAILGVLEHGSHTVGELAVVTAMSSASLNGNLRKLAAEGVVAKTRREGKVAWSLVSAD